MRAAKLSLAPVATGLVIANVVVVAVAFGCLLIARRAWELREHALTALAQAQAASSSAAGVRTFAATIHARVPHLRAATMDRMLLFGVLGAAASIYFTWRIVRAVRNR